MNLFGVMGISASGLSAERTRAEVVAGNMANAESTKTAEGGPYQRKEVVFQSQMPSGFRMQLAGAGNRMDAASAAGGARPQAERPSQRQRQRAAGDALRPLASGRQRGRNGGLSEHQSRAGDDGPDERIARLPDERQRGAGGEADDPAVH